MRVNTSKTYIRCRYRTSAITAAGNVAIDTVFNADSFSNALFSAEVIEENNSGGNAIKCTVVLKQDIAIELLSVVFFIPSSVAPKAFNRKYILQPVTNVLWNNDLTPLHIQYAYDGEELLIKNSTKFLSHKITPAADHFELEVFLDAAGLHPQVNYEKSITKSSASPLVKTGRKYVAGFCIVKPTSAQYPILNRFPNGYQSAFVLTDHCDFDTVINLKKFTGSYTDKDSWMNSGLKITKGVFQNASHKKGFMAATMAIPEYKTIIDELYKNGNEIAPHALNQSGQVSYEQFINSLDTLKEAYTCRSWIEHGNYLSYSYYMGGKDNEYKLTQQLNERGYNNIWSYYDVSVSPFSSINLFEDTMNSAVTDTKIIFKKLLKGQFLFSFHIFRSYFTRHNNGQKYIAFLLGIFSKSRQMLMSVIKRHQVKKSLKQLLKALAGKDNKRVYTYVPFTKEEINHFSPVFFSEANGSLAQVQPNDILMFTTQEVVHTSDIYTPAALAALVKEKGLHIGHTYILNQLPYINGIFTKDGSLKKEWTVFTERLKELAATKAIWNCNMGELTAYIKTLSLLDISYLPQCIRIKNDSAVKAEGITFSMPYAERQPTILWNKVQLDNASFYSETATITFWGEVPANTQIDIEWQ